MIAQSTGGWIRTFSGLKVDPLNPSPADIRIEDIAHALSNICRWTGHTRVFYSVAQHSVMVSSLCRGIEQQLWGLLHDASEAYLSDLNRPIKHSHGMAAYREAEERLMRVIAARFDLPWPMPEPVKDADNIALATEARDLMNDDTNDWWWRPPAPLSRRIIPLNPMDAKDRFMLFYRAIIHDMEKKG